MPRMSAPIPSSICDIKPWCAAITQATASLREPLAQLAVGWELALLALIVHVPFLRQPFGTFTFAWSDWALTAAVALTIVPVLEAVKWLERRGLLGEPN